MKLRVVFGYSSHLPGHLFLDDHLEKGPQIIADLARILLCVGLDAVALTADIDKAIFQILEQPRDRDALRFLWHEEPPNGPHSLPMVEEWRMTRVPFGKFDCTASCGQNLARQLF